MSVEDQSNVNEEHIGETPEKPAFEKPKLGIVYIVDCHNYNGTTMSHRVITEVLNNVKHAPIFYPKDRFALLFFGANGDPSEGLPKGVKLGHKMMIATRDMLVNYRNLFPTTVLVKPTPLLSAFQAAQAIFQGCPKINDRRIVFIAQPSFNEHYRITSDISNFILKNSETMGEPIFYCESPIEVTPYRCFKLEYLDRISIAFHKSFGYRYTFIPFSGRSEERR